MCISRNNDIVRPLKQEQRKSTQMKDSYFIQSDKARAVYKQMPASFSFSQTRHSTSQFKSLYALINRFSKKTLQHFKTSTFYEVTCP